MRLMALVCLVGSVVPAASATLRDRPLSLQNMGESCFMNALVQMYYPTILTRQLLTGLGCPALENNSLLKAFRDFLIAYGKGKDAAPRLYDALASHPYEIVEKGAQEDAADVLQRFFPFLEQDIKKNNCKHNPFEHTARGVLTIRAEECFKSGVGGREKHEDLVFYNLSLRPLTPPQEKEFRASGLIPVVDVQQALNSYFAPSLSCLPGKTTQQNFLTKAPSLLVLFVPLVIDYKSVVGKPMIYTKIEKVKVPETIYIEQSWLLNVPSRPRIETKTLLYRLRGLIAHRGQAAAATGHYMALVRYGKFQWYVCNDKALSGEKVVSVSKEYVREQLEEYGRFPEKDKWGIPTIMLYEQEEEVARIEASMDVADFERDLKLIETIARLRK
jgi:hypothetical protein